MKKILTLTLTIIMTCTALGSCGETAQQSAESKAETTTTTTTAAETTTTEVTSTETHKEKETTTTKVTEAETTTTTTEIADESTAETIVSTVEQVSEPEVVYADLKEAFIGYIEKYLDKKVTGISYRDGGYEATVDGNEVIFLELPHFLSEEEALALYSNDKYFKVAYENRFDYRFIIYYNDIDYTPIDKTNFEDANQEKSLYKDYITLVRENTPLKIIGADFNTNSGEFELTLEDGSKTVLASLGTSGYEEANALYNSYDIKLVIEEENWAGLRMYVTCVWEEQ